MLSLPLLAAILLALALCGLAMADFIPGPPDADLALQASVTKTADFDGAWLDLGKEFAPGGLGMPAAAVVNITALVTNDLDETYAFTLQECDPDANGDPDAGTVRNAGAAKAATATGITIAKGIITGRFVRLSLDVGGTTPSVTYSALLNP